MLLAKVFLEHLVFSLLRRDVLVDGLVQLLPLFFQLRKVLRREGCLRQRLPEGGASRGSLAVASLRHLESCFLASQHVHEDLGSFGQRFTKCRGRPAGAQRRCSGGENGVVCAVARCRRVGTTASYESCTMYVTATLYFRDRRDLCTRRRARRPKTSQRLPAFIKVWALCRLAQPGLPGIETSLPSGK